VGWLLVWHVVLPMPCRQVKPFQRAIWLRQPMEFPEVTQPRPG
jgi:hypothetical protein